MLGVEAEGEERGETLVELSKQKKAKKIYF